MKKNESNICILVLLSNAPVRACIPSYGEESVGVQRAKTIFASGSCSPPSSMPSAHKSHMRSIVGPGPCTDSLKIFS